MSHPLGNLKYLFQQPDESSVFLSFLILFTYKTTDSYADSFEILTARYVVSFLFPGLRNCLGGFPPLQGMVWKQLASDILS